MRRVLLDENLPRLLGRALSGVDVRTVAEVGWAGTKNGALLRLAETEFDVFVTADRNLPHQQMLRALALGVIVLAAGSTKLDDLSSLVPEIQEAVSGVRPGEIRYVPPV